MAQTVKPTDTSESQVSGKVRQNKYLISAWSDHIWVILTPALALLPIVLFSIPRAEKNGYLDNPSTPQWLIFGAALLTFAHLVLVFVRSHMNLSIRRSYPLRFLLAPLLLLAFLLSNHLVYLLMTTIALHWDEYHSVKQTFGIGRHYDRRAGVLNESDRMWDLAFCFCFQLIPFTILITYLTPSDVTSILDFEEFPLPFNEAFLLAARWIMTVMMVAVGSAYLLRILIGARSGRLPSRNKMLLFALTAFSSGVIASQYSFLDGFIVGNIYHAIQYGFFVIHFERNTLTHSALTNPIKRKKGRPLVLASSLLILMALVSAWVRIETEHLPLLAEIWLSVSLLHFWYDGFIWSVGKGQIS